MERSKSGFLHSSFRVLYAAFFLQFSLILPLSIASTGDEFSNRVVIESYLLFLKCTAIPALILLHCTLRKCTHASLHRWLYQSLMRSFSGVCRHGKRKSSRTSFGKNETLRFDMMATIVPPNETQTMDMSTCTRHQLAETDAEEDFNAGAVVANDSLASNNGHDEKSGSNLYDCITHDGKISSQSPSIVKTNGNGCKKTPPHDHEHSGEVPVSFPDRLMCIGAFGFGFAGMILNILRISDRWTSPLYHEQCRSALSIWIYSLSILFFIVQTYFLFSHQGLGFRGSQGGIRFVVVHLVVTNIALWINEVVAEVSEDLRERTYEDLRNHTVGNTTFLAIVLAFKRHPSNVTQMLENEPPQTKKSFLLYFCHSQDVISLSAGVYMFPLLVEYFIISASILWKIYHNHETSRNKHQGKTNHDEDLGEISQESEKGRKKACACKSLSGLIVGIVFFLLTLVSVSMFLTVLSRKKEEEEIVLEEQLIVTERIDHRRDVLLKANASTKASRREESTEAENGTDYELVQAEKEFEKYEKAVIRDTLLALFIYQSAELGLVIPALVACVIAFVKFHKHFSIREARQSERIDEQEMFIGFGGMMAYNTFIVIFSLDRTKDEFTPQLAAWLCKTTVSLVQVILQLGFIMRGFRSSLPSNKVSEAPAKALIIFLMLINLSLWLMNTFQMKYVDQLLDLYNTSETSVTPWSIIVHLLIPFTIFFRFHSIMALLHIWHVAYEPV